ncbi:MAG TPA: hypothetical protein VE074_00150 [Jatrophihabitantaceae bacterium]|nr:hypothetical protein [Jatrophihabitantaceae bacterium]
MTDQRAITEYRVAAADLKVGDLVNTSPGGDDDWQEVLAVYPNPSTLGGGAPNDERTLVKSLSGRYVVVQLTDIAPVDSNVYFADGAALAVSTDGGDDLPIADVTSGEDGVRTYLYTKFELVTVRGK